MPATATRAAKHRRKRTRPKARPRAAHRKTRVSLPHTFSQAAEQAESALPKLYHSTQDRTGYCTLFCDPMAVSVVHGPFFGSKNRSHFQLQAGGPPQLVELRATPKGAAPPASENYSTSCQLQYLVKRADGLCSESCRQYPASGRCWRRKRMDRRRWSRGCHCGAPASAASGGSALLSLVGWRPQHI